MMRREGVTRRDWLALSGLALGAMAARPAEGTRAVSAGPVEPVSIAKVRSYDEDLATRFRTMFDQIGGIGSQVQGEDGRHQGQSDRRQTIRGIHGGRHALGAPPRGRRGGRGVR